jgi:flavin-binding protein dodecin
MAYSGGGNGRRLEEGIFWGRSEESLDDAIKAAVGVIPDDLAEQRTVFVVTSIEVEIVGDPDVGAYRVTVM